MVCYNIAPTQEILVVVQEPGTATRQARRHRWGLIPSWAKDPAIGNQLINAQVETAATKPAFRVAFRKRRCLILADGFYEWQVEPGKKARVPHYIRMKDEKPFSFAGLWSEWRSADGSELRSCAIITTEPNELMAEIHNRMPVILDKKHFDRWLDRDYKETKELKKLLVPYPARKMKAYPVSRLVSNSRNDVPECLEPLEEP